VAIASTNNFLFRYMNYPYGIDSDVIATREQPAAAWLLESTFPRMPGVPQVAETAR
jgi:hypothetical protein